MNEYISNYENSDLSEKIKNKRILIINTKLKQDEILKKIELLKKLFIDEFNKSDIDYELEPNLNHMMILLKGSILDNDYCKKINKAFSINEIENNLNKENTEEIDIGYLKEYIKLYKILDEINEMYLDLRSILFNTISLVFDKDPEESNIDDLIKEELTSLVENETLDETTYNILSEFMKFFLEEKAIMLM
ncbi:MAG: hypothetical protein J6O62_03920 [Bacilli bacterium]|nr:hypothetical protein [Bacilli bacterium]MBO6194792.1 hypothetical protein [Bacilli bacterium]